MQGRLGQQASLEIISSICHQQWGDPSERDTIKRIYILQGSRADSVEVCRQPQVEQGSQPLSCCPPAAPSSSSSDNSIVVDCIDWISSAVIEKPASFAISTVASAETAALSFSCNSVSDFTFSRNDFNCSSDIWELTERWLWHNRSSSSVSNKKTR